MFDIYLEKFRKYHWVEITDW